MDQQLLVFVTVVEKGNFTKAAKQLHMTQPAVSQIIQNLETMYQTQLLERTNKYVRLNKAGEILYYYAKEIIGLYTKLGHLIDDLSNEPSGSLTIGASYTFGEYVLPQVITKLVSTYPKIKPQISIANTHDIAELVLRNQLDIGIIEGEYDDTHLTIEEFAEDEMYAVMSKNHALAKKENPQLIEFANAIWILREEGSGTREAADKVLRNMHIERENVLQFGSTQLIKEAVQSGLGVTILSEKAIEKELKSGELITVKVPGTPFKRKFSFIYRKTLFKTKATTVFLKLLKDFTY